FRASRQARPSTLIPLSRFLMRKLRVAFVAPSLRILSGQAVQANRLLGAWRGDPDVDAWLVPGHPLFPPPPRFAPDVQYLVSTEAGGVPAILAHERHGLLAPLGDFEMLAAHVLSLIADPEHARDTARAAYATCHACTWSAVRAQWLQTYRSVA